MPSEREAFGHELARLRWSDDRRRQAIGWLVVAVFALWVQVQTIERRGRRKGVL